MISVIIPAYNAAPHLKGALKSLQNQTFQDFEVIVVDDGSTDNSKEIIKRFANVKYCYQTNQGESAARNKGMSLAKGEYFAFLDADDWYESTKLEKQLNFLNNNPAIDIVYCDYKVYDEVTGKTSILRAELFHPERCNFFASILFRQILHTASATFKRQCYDSGCQFKHELKYAPDYDFSLQLLEKFTVGYIPEPLYGYRRHAHNTTNAHHKQRESEINIVKSLGKNRIRSLVGQTTFSKQQQDILLAKIFLKIGEYNESLTLLKAWLSTSQDPLLYFYAGNCHYLNNSPEKSLVYFRSALKLKNDFPEALNNLGCSLLKVGKTDKHEELFRKAICLRPGYMDPEYNLSGNLPLKITTFELRETLSHYY